MVLKKKDFFICITLGILIGLILKTPYLSYILVGILIGIFFAVCNEKYYINLSYFKNYPFKGLVWISSLIVINVIFGGILFYTQSSNTTFSIYVILIKLGLMIIPEFISFLTFSNFSILR